MPDPAAHPTASGGPAAPTPAELEGLRPLVRRLRPLVRRLVLDANEVDDVLQEVWLAGQRGLAGIATGARRSWLATTARRIAGHRRRREGERGEREAWARWGGRVPEEAALTRESVDQEVERLDVLGRLIEAVAELPDLERTAVSLRYFEGLPPRKIAGRIGRSPEQTRQVLHRGIQRLRSRLDAEHGDERRAWIGPLMGVGWPWAWRAGLATTAVLASVLLAILAVQGLAPGKPRADRLADAAGAGGNSAEVATVGAVSSEPDGTRAAATGSSRAAIGNPARSELRVIDGATGAPIDDVELHWAVEEAGQPWRAHREQRSGAAAPWIGADQRERAESLQVLARAAGYASGWWVLSPEQAARPCTLELWPRDRWIGGRVENDPGRPLGDVRVNLLLRPRSLAEPEPGEVRDASRHVPQLVAFAWEREQAAVTAADGSWRLAVSKDWPELEVRFEHARYMADGLLAGWPAQREALECGEHRWVLNSGRPVRGRVLDAAGQAVPGAHVQTLPRLSGKSRQPLTRTTTDERGWFEMGAPDGFEGWLRAEDDRGRCALVRFDAGVGLHRLELPARVAARLRLEDEAGRPLADWKIQWSDPGRDPAECWARTDERGRAELVGLPAGVEWLHAQRGRRAANWDALPANRSDAWIWSVPASVDLELLVLDGVGAPLDGPLEVEYLRREGESLLRRRLESEPLGSGHFRVGLNAEERAEPTAWLGVGARGHRRAFRTVAELGARATWTLQPEHALDLRPLEPRGDDLRFVFEVYPTATALHLDGVPPRIPAGVERWSWSDAPPADLDPELWVLGWARNDRGALMDTVCLGSVADFQASRSPREVSLAALRASLEEEPPGVRYELRGTQRVELHGVRFTRDFEHVHRPANDGRTLRLNHLLPGELSLIVERYERVERLPLAEADARELARVGAPFIAADGEALRLRIAAGGRLVVERCTARAERTLHLHAGRVAELELPR
jgi:RNA polymerase sigma factor (sigma-70 family)